MAQQVLKRLAKPCFTHVGGRLGRMLMEQFVEKGWIAKNKPGDKHFIITEKGEMEFEKLGIDLSQIKPEEGL